MTSKVPSPSRARFMDFLLHHAEGGSGNCRNQAIALTTRTDWVRIPPESRANRKLFRVRRPVGTFWLAKS
jgi:hypothetical protein